MNTTATGKSLQMSFSRIKLELEFGVPKEFTTECAQLLNDNGKFVGIIRDVAGAPRVVFDELPMEKEAEEEEANETSSQEHPRHPLLQPYKIRLQKAVPKKYSLPMVKTQSP